MQIDHSEKENLQIFALRFLFEADDVKSGLSTVYSGSAWRGVFGHALKETVCIFTQGHCENCKLKQSCAYPAVFEARQLLRTALILLAACQIRTRFGQQCLIKVFNTYISHFLAIKS